MPAIKFTGRNRKLLSRAGCKSLENAGHWTKWRKVLIWRVEFDDAAVKEQRKLDHLLQQDILRYFRARIATDQDPRRFGR